MGTREKRWLTSPPGMEKLGTLWDETILGKRLTSWLTVQSFPSL
jgi:hypothetical protein